MFEVACGNCQGRLLVQQAGVVVACPHCGSHLTIGGPPAAPTPPAPAPAPTFAPPPQPQFSAPPQPQYAPAPQQFAPPPQQQFAPAPQFAPPPAPQPYQQPQPPAPQPQFAPPSQQQFAPPPQPAPPPFVPQPVYQPVAEAPAPVAPAPAPVPIVPEPVAEQPATPSFFAPAEVPAESTGFDFGGGDDAVEANWMTPAEPAPQAPTFAEPAPAFAPQPFAAVEPTIPAPQPVAEQPMWAAAPAVEAPAAPSYEQQFASAPAAPAPAPMWAQPEAPAAAPAWPQAEAPAAYSPATQMAAQAAPAYQPAPAPQYAEQPAAYADPQAQQWYGAQTTAAPADNMAAAFGAAAATAAVQASPYGAAPSAYPTQPAAPAAQPTVAPAKAPATVPRGLFIMLANYASVMTLIAGYLYFNGAGGGGGNTGGGTNATERIPDVEPIKDTKTGKLIYQVVKPDSLLAEHQTLELGQTKRFGNLEVTPSKVRVGQIEFTTLQGGSADLMAPPTKVMQLHLTFKNVSKDQSIAPLRSLAFRQSKSERGYVSNIFVCPFNKRGRTILAYPLDEQALRVKGLDLDRELKPGESCDLFIPTAFKGVDEMLDKNKDFVWRVQFRKGYDSKNFGVTTLIEVKFDKSKVEMNG